MDRPLRHPAGERGIHALGKDDPAVIHMRIMHAFGLWGADQLEDAKRINTDNYARARRVLVDGAPESVL